MKKWGQRLLIVLSLALVGAYAVYQVYTVTVLGIKTEAARTVTVESTVAAEGYIVREETVLAAASAGMAANYVVEDGKRVAKDAVVAVFYLKASDAEVSRQVQEIDRKIAEFEANEGGRELLVTDIDKVETLIADAVYDAAYAATDSVSLRKMASKKSALVKLLNKKQLILGIVDNFDDRVRALEEQKAALLSHTRDQVGQLTAPRPGYFESATDGYEAVLTPAILENLTVSQYRAIDEGVVSPGQTDAGKLVTSYIWRYVCLLPEADAAELSPGLKLLLRFPYAGGAEVEAAVERISPAEDGMGAVVFRCERTPESLSSLRYTDAEIILTSYTGLRIPKQALHLDEDGQLYCYVRVGGQAVKRTVEQLYAKDNYILAADGLSSGVKGSVRLYDQVITQGRDLYDGKVIN